MNQQHSAPTCMDCLALAGRIIMENGGETYRAEETVTRMGTAFGLDDVESFAVPSGVFISYRGEDGVSHTTVVRIHGQDTDLSRVNEVNRISRAVEAGELDMPAAMARLEQVRTEKDGIPLWVRLLGAGVTSGCFAVLFGGGIREVLVSGTAAVLTQCLPLIRGRWHLRGYAFPLVGSFLTVLLVMLGCADAGTGLTDAAIAGALMPLVPGLAMTTAVQDVLRGDMMSGAANAMRAMLTAMLIAFGALAGTAVFRLAGGGLL